MSSHALTIQDALTVAKVAADSRLYKLDVPQAAMQVMAGAELGLGPVASLRSIHMVKGKPVMDYTVLGALVKRSGRYDYGVMLIRDDQGNVTGQRWNERECVLEFFEHFEGGRRVVGLSEFTWEDAKRAGLTSKDNWKNHPKAMLMARAVSQGVRAYCPDVTMGGVYVEGEIEEDDRAPIQLPPQRAEPSPRPQARQRPGPQVGEFAGQPTQATPSEVLDQVMTGTAVDFRDAPAGDQRVDGVIEVQDQHGQVVNRAEVGPRLIEIEIPGTTVIWARPAPDGFDPARWAQGACYAFQNYSSLDDNQAKTLRELAKTVTDAMGWQRLYEAHGRPKTGGAA